MLTFQELLKQAQAKVGPEAQKAAEELAKVRTEAAKIEEKIATLQKELAEKRSRIRELEAVANQAIRQAIQAAQLLGIEIPEEYYMSAKKVSNNGNGQRSKGKYYWESPGLAPFQAEVSRAMWRLSHGSGGSAGKNGEGVLTVEEFWSLVGRHEDSIALGEKITVTLPNGRRVTFQKIEE